MPPEKELHFFDRSPRYPSPNKLATASPVARLAGTDAWERPQTLEGARALLRAVRNRDAERATWLWRRHFGRYGIRWYRRVFRPGRACPASGEITPAYSILEPDDVAAIRVVNPEMRLILLLRDPVERAWSAIRYGVEKGRPASELRSPEVLVTRLRRSSLQRRGDYERTLDTYLRHFDRRQILVCFYEAIAHDPEGLLADVTAFLGVTPLAADAVDAGTRVNPSRHADMPPEVAEFLIDTYGPLAARLAKQFGSYARLWTAARADIPPPPPTGRPDRDGWPPTLHP